MRVLSVVLALTMMCAAQPPLHKLSEGSSSKLMIAYQKALLLQAQAAQAMAEVQAAIADYNKLVEGVNKAEGYPKGTTFVIDVKAGTVDPIAPPPDPRSKDAAREEKK